MDKQTLIARRDKAEQEFNQHQEELLRLQGEWRVINEQIDELDKAEESVSKEADKIDVTKVKGAKNG